MLPQDEVLMSRRPFIAPHHLTTKQALAGGGRVVSPGMVTLAHRGILFLDENPLISITGVSTQISIRSKIGPEILC